MTVLDFATQAVQKQMKVSLFSDNLYARHRLRGLPVAALREGRDSTPPEFLLQAVWQQQRLLRDRFKTLDGRTVRILHPGFKNHEAGPDFRGAIVQVGSEPAKTGDVEIDLHTNGWRAHGHENNPAFKQVILHVIWEGDRAAVEGMLTMALNNVLDAPLDELAIWLAQNSVRTLPENLQGKCCAPLRELSNERLTSLLHQAAQVRWQSKAKQLQARARQAGWEQALWEGLFRALGYKQNIWPMQSLAEGRERWLNPAGDATTCQARLFGISGLLPAQLTQQVSGDVYLRRIWDQWWRERTQFEDCILPRESWRFNAMRPANHPQRRLALAAHWLADGGLAKKLEAWFTASIANEALVDSLLKILQVEQDDFWSWHWTFRSARLPKSQPMLGAARVTDLAVNVILPWFWMRAVEGKKRRTAKSGGTALFELAGCRGQFQAAPRASKIIRQCKTRNSLWSGIATRAVANREGFL